MDAGDIYKLELSFLPQSEGKKSGSLIIQTIEPNAQAFTIDLYGEYYKTYTSLNKHSVDFGNVEFCQINNIDSILISNNGLLSDTLDIFVEGDRDIVNITPNDFIFVNNSSDVTFIINLVNDRLKAGLNNVKIELVSRVCSNTMQIDISANLIKPVLVINPNPLDFGELWMSEEKTLPLELTNNSNVDIEINDIELISNQFEVIGEKSFIIPANSIHSIMIKFTAKLEGIHDLPLKILYQTNCLDSDFVRLLSFVPNEEYSLTLRIDRHIVDAGGVVEIPIILDKVLSNISSDLVEINLQFDKELFYPLEVLPKNLNPKDFSFQYLAGNLDIKIVGESAHKLFLDSGDIILLKGITFASIPDSTSLEFTKIELNLNKPVNIYHQDGLLKLTDFCNGTAIFKLKWIPTFDASIPQVLDNDILKFTISASENININMEVIDANGILINRETLFATTNPNNFNIPFGEISNGLYFIKLSSSYKTKLYKMIFIR